MDSWINEWVGGYGTGKSVGLLQIAIRSLSSILTLRQSIFAKYTDMEHSINMYNVVIIAFYYVHTNRMETNDIHRQNQIDNS